MVNIEQITSTLAKLPDQALQRYAMMHKDDPYIMSLAVSESKRRKEMRSAAQSQGYQEQPKVVDQAVAEMAQPAQQMAPMPEEQGIGALPAAQQMNFADGGITGYAGGGDIFSQFDQQKADRLAQLNGQLATIEPQLRAAAASGDASAIQEYSQQAQAVRNEINSVRESAGNRLGLIDGSGARPSEPPARVTPSMPANQFNRMAGADRVNLPYSSGAPSDSPQDASAARAAEAQKIAQTNARFFASQPKNTEEAALLQRYPAAPKAASGIDGSTKVAEKKTPSAGIASIAPAAQGDMVTRARELANSLYDTREQDLALGELRNQTAGRAAELRETLAKRPKTKAMEGLEKNLKEEAAGEAGEKDQAKGMALFKAGLAIMSGSSPNALQNIGKGAMVGAEEYGGAIKELKKAAKDRQKLFAEIEEKRRLQEIGDWDAAAATDQKIADLQGKVQEKVLSFAEKTTGVKATMAGSLVSRELDEQAQNRRSAQSFANQLKLRDMPTYEQGLQKQYIQQWLAKPENKGKTEIDAVMALGLLGNAARAPTPTDMRMTAKEILDNPMDYSESDVAAARQVMRGVLGNQGAGGAGKFTVTAGGKTYTFPTQEAANKFKAEAGVK
jgi:hypothetical protein